MQVEEFEPVFLVPEGPALPSEAGKRWLDRCFTTIEYFRDVLVDLFKVAEIEMAEWDPRMNQLIEAEIPLMVSGIGQATMQKILDYMDNVTTTAFNPGGGTPTNLSLGISPASAPASTTTGTTFADGTSNYTGYARQTLTAATYWNASTAATPAVVTTKATITFAYTSGTATENGFMLCDSSTTNAGVNYFFGSLGGVVINSTQNPPTIASGSLSLSLTTT